MAHDSQDFSSPQEAIEGYLEALLQDVAEYDEPESPVEPVSKAEAVTERQANSDSFTSADTESKHTGSSDTGSTVDEPSAVDKPSAVSEPLSTDESSTVDETGARIFAPPSARAYAREAAAQIRQRQQAAENFEPKFDTAFKELPTILMPELKVAEPEVKVEVETQSAVKTSIAEESVAVEPAVAEPVAVEAVETMVAEETVAVASTADIASTSLEPQQNEGWTNGRPDWAQNRFECLLFVVKGLKLAVPLAELGGIHKLEKEPTPLFGQPGWFLGIVRTNNMNVGLVDTAQWVMSERIKGDHKPDFKFAIRIHDSEWGLACHEVAEAISLDPSEVKWRTKLGRRPWLAGTVVDHMCALIDVAAFARLLDSDKVPVDLQALMADEE
jgi:purine-binding chemotaxis protein CheW